MLYESITKRTKAKKIVVCIKMLRQKCGKIKRDEIKDGNIRDSVDVAHIVENVMEIRLRVVCACREKTN